MNDRLKFRVWDGYNMREVIGLDLEYDRACTYKGWHDEEYVDCGKNERGIVMQYVGREDKNGNLIYENDLLKVHDFSGKENLLKITWDKEGCDYILVNKENVFVRSFGIDGDQYEVVGNIYEHPDRFQLYVIKDILDS